MNRLDAVKLLSFFVFVCFLFFWNSYSESDSFYDRMLLNRVEESYSGIVVGKYIDEKEHNIPMLRFKDDSEVGIENRYWDRISLGDSIVKKKGSSLILVYRQGKFVKKFDYVSYFDDLKKYN